jgi:hypothetical protein
MAIPLRRLPFTRTSPLALAALVGCAGLVGCAAERPAQMVDALPPPNFNGPTLTAVSDPVRSAPAVPRAAVARPQPEPVVVVRPPAAPAFPVGVPRDWVPIAAANKWRWIVVHHSATPVGGAARFNREHQAKGWDELGYHFVIGNGTDTGAGAVEVGNRWSRQKHGAHCKTPDNRFNEEGIGVCLVGNFDQTRPSDAQLKALARLVAHLQRTFDIPADRVIGHGDAKATECPGRHLRIAAVRRLSAQALADAGDPVPSSSAAVAVPVVAPVTAGPAARTASARAADTELMFDSRRPR